MNRLTLIAISVLLALLAACERTKAPVPAATLTTAPLPSPATHPPATLVPTFTPLATAAPAPTATPSGEPTAGQEAGPSPTPPAFDEVIVELRFVVPALGLDRRLTGNRANRIVLVDESSGRQAEYGNQGGILFEMRQALSTTELQPLPDGCETCVFLEYSLSIEGQEGAGWLQDDVLLASLENYMAIALGPFFPPEAVFGLRRSASPYAPAHSLALTAGGDLWTWLATEGQIAEPSATITETSRLRTALDDLPLSALDENYVADCPGSPVETLYINADGDSKLVNIVCPEFSIPSTLLPVYAAADALARPLVAGVSLPRPPAAFPLSALFDYRRPDLTRLTLYDDGRLVGLDSEAKPYTTTLTATEVVSLTTELQQSGELRPGLSSYMIDATATITAGAPAETPPLRTILVLRGTDGFYDGEWLDKTGVAILERLDALLEQLINAPEPSTPGTPAAGTPAPGTPTVTPTGVPEEPEATATATSPATPTPTSSP